MPKQTFIFMGPSGCGKGTQAKLLVDFIKKNDPSQDFLYIYTGQEFRNFIKGDNFTQKITSDLYSKGALMPEFLTVYLWIKYLVENYNGNQHIIFDGTPRRYHEAGVLHSIFDFYKLGKPWVIHLELTPEEAMKRLIARKRMDDNEEDIKKRLAWYQTDVIPTIGYYRNNSEYNFLTVDGNRSIEEIHADIVKKLQLE